MSEIPCYLPSENPFSIKSKRLKVFSCCFFLSFRYYSLISIRTNRNVYSCCMWNNEQKLEGFDFFVKSSKFITEVRNIVFVAFISCVVFIIHYRITITGLLTIDDGGIQDFQMLILPIILLWVCIHKNIRF